MIFVRVRGCRITPPAESETKGRSERKGVGISRIRAGRFGAEDVRHPEHPREKCMRKD